MASCGGLVSVAGACLLFGIDAGLPGDHVSTGLLWGICAPTSLWALNDDVAELADRPVQGTDIGAGHRGAGHRVDLPTAGGAAPDVVAVGGDNPALLHRGDGESRTCADFTAFLQVHTAARGGVDTAAAGAG